MQGAKAKKPRNNGVTVFQVVNKPEQSYWSEVLAPFLLPQSNPFNLSAFAVAVREQLEQQVGCDIVAMYAILHDKDEHGDGELKDEHMHILVKVKVPIQLNKIADCLGVEPQFIEKIKAGRYGFANSLAYLIHAKDPDKYQYAPSEVVTVVGTPYADICAANSDTWRLGRCVKLEKVAKERAPLLRDLIKQRQITRDQLLDQPFGKDGWFDVYYTDPVGFDRCFNTINECHSRTVFQALQRHDLDKVSIYVTGAAGSGKSHFCQVVADELCRQAKQDGVDWSCIDLCEAHSFDSYSGQQVVIVDDLRSSSMAINTWLRFLDPSANRNVAARYANKKLVNLVTFHNCVQDMGAFYGPYVDAGEPFEQFLRRYSFHVWVYKSYNPDGSLRRDFHICEIREGKAGYSKYPLFGGQALQFDEAVTKLCELIKARIKAWGVDAKGQLITFKSAQ